MPPRLKPSFISPKCTFARSYATTKAASAKPPPPPASSGYTRLTTRRLLAVHGTDAIDFLHGITTVNLRAGQTSGFYAAFLTSQGRIHNDVFIYPTARSAAYRSTLPEKLTQGSNASAPAYFIEVDANEVDTLYKHIKKYKLRAKVDIRAIDEGEWNVWSIWDEGEPWTPHPAQASEGGDTAISGGTSAPPQSETDDTIGALDARAPGMGRRLILPRDASPASALPNSSSQADLSAYTLRRILRGVPEGQDEIPRETGLPQNYNIDFMGGIDFRKGCYLGQELTIRTHHTGIVRKRVLPVMLYGAEEKQPTKHEYIPDTDLASPLVPFSDIVPIGKRSKRPVGKWITGVGNVGLGLCRLERLADIVLTDTVEGRNRWTPEDEFNVVAGVSEEGEGSEQVAEEAKVEEGKEVKIRAFMPDWHRSKTKVRKRQVII